jgi:hypothetical protein
MDFANLTDFSSCGLARIADINNNPAQLARVPATTSL